MHNFIDEKFWLAIAFIAFVVIMLRYVWPILSQKISEQSKQIAKDLLEAKEMKESAEKLLKDCKVQYENAVESSKKLVKDAEIEAKKFLEDSKKTIEKDVEKKVEALNSRIKSEEEKAVREIKKKIVAGAFEKIEAGIKNPQKDYKEVTVKNALDDISKIV